LSTSSDIVDVAGVKIGVQNLASTQRVEHAGRVDGLGAHGDKGPRYSTKTQGSVYITEFTNAH